MAYKDYIEKMKSRWIGKTVLYDGQPYKVMDVDYNGGLLINRPQYYCASYTASTTAVGDWMIQEVC